LKSLMGDHWAQGNPGQNIRSNQHEDSFSAEGRLIGPGGRLPNIIGLIISDDNRLGGPRGGRLQRKSIPIRRIFFWFPRGALPVLKGGARRFQVFR